MKRILAVILSCALIFAFAKLSGIDLPHFKEAHAQSTCIGCGVWGMEKKSGGSPTWTATDAELNETCGFVTTCNITVNVTAGFQVIGIGGNVSSPIVSVSLCSTNIPTEVITTGLIGTLYEASLWTGTVSCSGSQTLAVTGGANDLRFIYAGIGVLANLSSTTATGSCKNSAAPTASSTLACSTGGPLTVPSNGFAIGWAYQSFGSAVSFTNLTGTQATTGASGAGAIGDSSSAGSLTPTANVFNGAAGAGIVAATWH